MRDFKQLLVWQKAHHLTLTTYAVTRSFPAEERYGLTSQLRRAASSIPTNLAEGCGRREYLQFVGIASGSALETEYHLLLARDLNYLKVAQYATLDGQLQEIKRMLAGLRQSLERPMFPNA